MTTVQNETPRLNAKRFGVSPLPGRPDENIHPLNPLELGIRDSGFRIRSEVASPNPESRLLNAAFLQQLEEQHDHQREQRSALDEGRQDDRCRLNVARRFRLTRHPLGGRGADAARYRTRRR